MAKATTTTTRATAATAKSMEKRTRHVRVSQLLTATSSSSSKDEIDSGTETPPTNSRPRRRMARRASFSSVSSSSSSEASDDFYQESTRARPLPHSSALERPSAVQSIQPFDLANDAWFLLFITCPLAVLEANPIPAQIQNVPQQEQHQTSLVLPQGKITYINCDI